MEKNTIWIIPFTGENVKWCMWSVKFMEISGINRYDILLTGDRKILSDDSDKTKVKLVSYMKLLNITAYNDLILTKEDMVCFHIVDKARTKANKYGDARQAYIKFSRKLDPTTRASKILLRNKFSKSELFYLKRNPEYWIIKIELLRVYLQKLDAQIDDSGMMTHILINIRCCYNC